MAALQAREAPAAARSPPDRVMPAHEAPDSEIRPGRACPIDYRYTPEAISAATPLETDVLWVVGGLYGNTEALATLSRLLEAERASRVEVVLNGDFHWFDATPEAFAAVAAGTSGWHAMRGNVETELARQGDIDAGCGCAYPDAVPQDDVDRSNAMMVRLRDTARTLGLAGALSGLPMVRRAHVGALRVGIVHGDDRSLAGWRLAQDQLENSWRDGLDDSLEAARIDLLASSHTCLPVAGTFESRSSGRLLGVINNGAAGMANFADSTYGVVTRIAPRGSTAPGAARMLYSTLLGDCEVQALAIDFDARRWLDSFDASWPAGSPAERSYRSRIVGGPAYALSAAIRGRFRASA
jgi:hypothetical protein